MTIIFQFSSSLYLQPIHSRSIPGQIRYNSTNADMKSGMGCRNTTSTLAWQRCRFANVSFAWMSAVLLYLLACRYRVRMANIVRKLFLSSSNQLLFHSVTTDLLKLPLSEVHISCIVVCQCIGWICLNCSLIVSNGIHEVTHKLCGQANYTKAA